MKRYGSDAARRAVLRSAVQVGSMPAAAVAGAAAALGAAAAHAEQSTALPSGSSAPSFHGQGQWQGQQQGQMQSQGQTQTQGQGQGQGQGQEAQQLPGLVILVGCACSREDVPSAIGRWFSHMLQLGAPGRDELPGLLQGALGAAAQDMSQEVVRSTALMMAGLLPQDVRGGAADAAAAAAAERTSLQQALADAEAWERQQQQQQQSGLDVSGTLYGGSGEGTGTGGAAAGPLPESDLHHAYAAGAGEAHELRLDGSQQQDVASDSGSVAQDAVVVADASCRLQVGQEHLQAALGRVKARTATEVRGRLFKQPCRAVCCSACSNQSPGRAQIHNTFLLHAMFKDCTWGAPACSDDPHWLQWSHLNLHTL